MFEQKHIDYWEASVQYKAVLYMRVKDRKQATKGSVIQSQKSRAREYTKFLVISVAETFHDDGVSGKLLDRPAAQSMLTFLRQSPPGVRYVVIIDEISRLAPDYRVHMDSRDAIEGAGAALESPFIVFKAICNADSNYVEGIQALGAQHLRDKNAETIRKRKWAWLNGGHWPYNAPLGYKFQRTHAHGNLLVWDAPMASILAEAFEGYASGRLTSQADVERFFEAQPEFPGKLPDGTLRMERVTDLISHPIYAGYVFCDKLGIPLTKAQHLPLISLQTFEKMKARRSGTTVAPAHKDLHQDFPLRGAVCCAECQKPLRSAWSKGKCKNYDFYECETKGCPSYRKSIRRADIEGRFVALLRSLLPSAELFAVVASMVFDAWDQQAAQVEAVKSALKREIRTLDKPVDRLLDRMVKNTSTRAAPAFERKIDPVGRQKLLAQEKLENCGAPRQSAAYVFEL